jgi:hypothetical protein
MVERQALRLRLWNFNATESKEDPMGTKTSAKGLLRFLGLAMLLIGQQAAAQGSGLTEGQTLPPNAKAGECYARVLVPAVYKTETLTMLKRDASEKVGIVPATYQTTTEQKLLKEASTRIEVVPATYEVVEEQVLVKPASSQLEVVPAVFETVTEQVLEKAGYTYWKKGTGAITKVDYMTGEIMCLVEVPPVYRTVTKEVLKTPATTREIPEPAVYSTVKYQKLKTPETTRVVAVPAEYQTIQVRRLVEPPSAVRTPIPAEYQTVTKAVLVSDERFEWQTVMCETNTPAPPPPAPVKGAGYDNSNNPGFYNDFTKGADGTLWAPGGAVGPSGYRRP